MSFFGFGQSKSKNDQGLPNQSGQPQQINQYADPQRYLIEQIEKEKQQSRQKQSIEEQQKKEYAEKVQKMMTSPHSNPDLDMTEEDHLNQNIDVLNQHIKNSIQRLQIKISQRMNLDMMLNSCIQTKCDALQKEGLKAIESAYQRKNNDDKELIQSYGSKGVPKKFSFILEPNEFIESKVTNLEEAIAFEKAVICMQQCQLPIDIVKRILKANVEQLQQNIQNCYTQCNQNGFIENDKKIGNFQEKDVLQCKIKCLDNNKEIMKAIEMEIGHGLPQYSNDIINIL